MLQARPRRGEMKKVRLDGRPGEEGGAGLFGRARYLGHPGLAQGDLWLRGGDLHRRYRPGRGAGAGARKGEASGRQIHLHRRSARGVRARLRVPDVPRQRALRGQLSPWHLDRAAADRQAPDRDRHRGRRRRGRARRHRQGQRPGALRARLLRLEARHPRDRAVARVGPFLAHRAHRLCRGAPDPDPARQARRGAVLGGCQPPAHLGRGQNPRRPVGRAGGDSSLLAAPRSRPENAPDERPRNMSRSSFGAATPSRWTASRCRPRRC